MHKWYSKKNNSRLLGFWDNGVRHLSSKIKDIFIPDDYKNKILRATPSPLHINIFKSFNQLEMDSVELHNAAVSDKTGTTIFYENSFSGKSSIHSDVNSDTSMNSYEVNICSFNSMAEQYDVIDYLKVDCEGAEYEIFESIPKEFLTNRIRKIALEFHHNINDIKVINLISKIKECGFETKLDYNDNDSTGMLYARNSNQCWIWTTKN